MHGRWLDEVMELTRAEFSFARSLGYFGRLGYGRLGKGMVDRCSHDFVRFRESDEIEEGEEEEMEKKKKTNKGRAVAHCCLPDMEASCRDIFTLV